MSISDHHPFVGAAVHGPLFGTVTIRNRGHLPHWEADAACYFVTFRLADSIPAAVAARIRMQKSHLACAVSERNLLPVETRLRKKLSSKTIEKLLDQGSGSCTLRQPRIAKVVAKAVMFWQHKRYRLLAWCVMPNHVHAVLKLHPGENLASIIHSWKSYTAHNVNGILGRTGDLWQREYYDHLIRDEKELDRAIDYVLLNPEKAGMKNWRWVWSVE